MGRAPCCDKANVKRGPWSPEEDVMLKTYVERYGTGGNWIALPQKAGLKRCGKSCRLRWLNYLRPDIKHGGFTEEEDNIICSLYKSIGSRWSVIASQLPGRTDNDVKNYWNTKLKKKLLGPKPIIDQFGQDHLVHTTTTATTSTMKSNSSSSSSTSSPSRSTLTIQTPNIIPKLEGSPYSTVSNFSYSHASYEENNTSGGTVDFTNSCVREPQNFVSCSQDMFSFETRSAVIDPTNIRLPASEFCFTSTQGLSPSSTDMSYISWFLNGIGDDGLAIMDFVNGSSSNQINGGGFPEQKVLDVGDSSFCNNSTSQLNLPYSSLMSNPDINHAQSQWLYQSI